ncbi:HAD hydrolase family protein [Atopobium sp. oral taxon 416]|uniref:HAD hydrolase family protein n=1 Tax=Atopobium sp. oral taxon 416 TaxID=712157 RepID=UPI001BA5BA98|nr:HAD hydrolase family protein [Atopobium sp. oral taxon 416]QUC03660.1 HAD hydrolase family protein [Atopobium sp. oral taxon 416]
MDYKPTDESTLDFLRDVPITKVLYCIPNGMDELRAIERGIPSNLEAGTSTTFRSERYLEFNPAGVDKGAGLRQLAELLGISLVQSCNLLVDSGIQGLAADMLCPDTHLPTPAD